MDHQNYEESFQCVASEVTELQPNAEIINCCNFKCVPTTFSETLLVIERDRKYKIREEENEVK